MTFPFYKQFDKMDCGPTALRMVAKYYGKSYSLQSLRDKCQISRKGVSLLGINEAAEAIGFNTQAARISFEKLALATHPCIVHWDQNHFVVLYKISRKKIFSSDYKIKIADPRKGLLEYSKEDFLKGWCNDPATQVGIVLILDPSRTFYELEGEEEKKAGLANLLHYLYPHRKLIVQLGFGLLSGTMLQLALPFLTQSVIDTGINTHNLSFVYLVLIAQLMLFAGRTVVEFIRSWILLQISSRINISILSDFITKLMRLPISFFDTKMFGDLMQRINDRNRIESFLTNSTLSTLFSLVNLLVFGIIISYYSMPIFGIFLLASAAYSAWVFAFQKSRRNLDNKRFGVSAAYQSNLVQMIGGMQDIKLANCETNKRWGLERIQAKLYNLGLKSLALSQYQSAGAFFINEGKNILITFLSAKAVIEGQLTLGTMLSIQYIIGQLNSPVEQFVGFIRSAQDASMSLERMNEIYEIKDEEPVNSSFITHFPQHKSISLNNLSFKYPGISGDHVLDNLDLHIPEGKVTAIVGMSGSGKTTLLKLLLKFYEPTGGEIRLGDMNMKNISPGFWRGKCGLVMQDGYIFSDTIARNIAFGDEYPDMNRLMEAVNIANIREFIDSLPEGYNTKIGAEGNGISQGQKQRILIARAVYKDPEFIFFDEATNSLDANNEKVILKNMDDFFVGRTVVVVAHRLSTVKNADKIVVLDKGKIVEEGTHAELTFLKKDYYHLVKNQLELGN